MAGRESRDEEEQGERRGGREYRERGGKRDNLNLRGRRKGERAGEREREGDKDEGRLKR